MLEWIKLQNYKCFGLQQVAHLSPITVIVGPNNSGKSTFLQVGAWCRGLSSAGTKGGVWTMDSAAIHRPLQGADRTVALALSDGICGYVLEVLPGSGYEERISVGNDVVIHIRNGESLRGFPRNARFTPFQWYTALASFVPSSAPAAATAPTIDAIRNLVRPLTESRDVRLVLNALRATYTMTQIPAQLGFDGSGLSSIVAKWRAGEPAKAERLTQLVRRFVPEIRNVLADFPGGNARLLFEHDDGQRFTAEEVSDGVILFTALLAHAIDAPPGGLMFLEEPELSIHPRRLRDFVDVLRELTVQQGNQFIIATHAPTLLDAFRDEPEAILLFRRSEHGTKIKRLTDAPELVESLQRSTPGELLANGYFNDPV